MAKKFTTVEELNKTVSEFLKSSVSQIGYIIPGHGMKGKTTVIRQDSDLKTMYAIFYSKRDIVLCCIGELRDNLVSGRKHSNTDVASLPKAKSAKIMTDVREIIEKLRSKHGSKYSIEKYSAWAHMIHMQKYESYDNIPDLPYFSGRKAVTKISTPGTLLILLQKLLITLKKDQNALTN